MGKILPQIDHIIVVMLENRSLDNLCGWRYADATPGHLIPQGSNPSFDGVNAGLSIQPSNIRSFPEDLFLFLLTLVILRSVGLTTERAFRVRT